MNILLLNSTDLKNYGLLKNEVNNIIIDNEYDINNIITTTDNILVNRYCSEYSIKCIETKTIKKKDIECVIAIIERDDILLRDFLDKLNVKKYIIFYNKVERINEEGVYMDKNGEYIFNYKRDTKNDILTLTYNKSFLYTNYLDNDIELYYSYKLNRSKKYTKEERREFISFIKYDLKTKKEYTKFISQACHGFKNNPNFNLEDIDVIVYPESSSSLNMDVVNSLKKMVKNKLILSDVVVKEYLENVQVDYDEMLLFVEPKEVNSLKKLIKKLKEESNIFSMKRIPTEYRKYVYNFLNFDNVSKEIMNRLYNGRVLVVDDLATMGTTHGEINRIIEEYAPIEVYNYSIIS